MKLPLLLRPGALLPYIGKRRIPVNRDGSIFDTGEPDLLDEISPFYIEAWVFEWLMIGIPLQRHGFVIDAKTGLPAAPHPNDDQA